MTTAVCFSDVLTRASLIPQLVKNLPVMQETWVRFLCREDPLEKGKATHSSILAWRVPWTSPWVSRSLTQLSDFHFTSQMEKAAW